MEFIRTANYLSGDFFVQITFEKLKTLEGVLVDQNLKILQDAKNIELLEYYGNLGFKVVPIRRVSSEKFVSRSFFPRRILAEMTNRCNSNCRMCPRTHLGRDDIDMDKELYKDIIDEADKYGVDYFALYHFGESALHKDFRELSSYVGKKENLNSVWLSTNGIAFDQELAKFILLESGIDFLNYSMHATNAETYAFVTPSISYKKVRNNLDGLLDLKRKFNQGPIFHIQMIDQEGTHHNIDEFIETFYESGEVISILYLEYTDLPNNKFGLNRERPIQVTRCNRISRNDCFIDSNGNVHPCEFTAYNASIVLGNVNKNSVFEIWNSDLAKKIRGLNEDGRMHEMDCCKNCKDFDL